MHCVYKLVDYLYTFKPFFLCNCEKKKFSTISKLTLNYCSHYYLQNYDYSDYVKSAFNSDFHDFWVFFDTVIYDLVF